VSIAPFKKQSRFFSDQTFKKDQNPYYEYAWQNKWQGGGPLGLPQDCAAKMNVVKYRTAEYRV